MLLCGEDIKDLDKEVTKVVNNLNTWIFPIKLCKKLTMKKMQFFWTFAEYGMV